MTGLSANPSSVSEPGGGPRLGPRDIHLWLCHRDSAGSSEAFRRRVLSRYAPIDPQDWQFECGEHGKPRLVDAPLPLEFNLSHSGEWLLCAVSAGTALGVDLEHTRRERDFLRLARRFFSAPEVAVLESLDGGERAERFFDYWTLKEAAVKARGGALAPELRRRCFELHYPGAANPGEIRPRFARETHPGHYYLVDALPDYRLAVCWLPEPGEGAPSLRLINLSGDPRPRTPLLRAASV
ncbi:MAG: 4'-phosphopantetheinyl transferase superfamily protein [Halioglobus sp.]|nr:4'-phosphopantetheinyl transferase superfamily protein [Halioglobus sp.]